MFGPWTTPHTEVDTDRVKAKHLVCRLRGHRWHRYRREGLDMRECLRCGYVVRADSDRPKMIDL
jgi:Zn ribbon nucleic-acid-binding protein